MKQQLFRVALVILTLSLVGCSDEEKAQFIVDDFGRLTCGTEVCTGDKPICRIDYPGIQSESIDYTCNALPSACTTVNCDCLAADPLFADGDCVNDSGFALVTISRP